jgi:hypothetical protein
MERNPLINREREIAELRDALAGALAGHGRVVLLAGEPGIGKTRLARLVAGEAEARGVPVWWGRGWEDGSAPAFWPWNTALRRWIDHGGSADVAAAVGAWGAELAHVFPVLRERLPSLPASEQWESDRARFRVFDAVSRFLGAVAAPAGLVVVLDDLHWADRSSLKLLEFVAADLLDTRLLVVATYRDTEVQRDDPLAATLSSLVREPVTSRLLLGGLTPTHCAEWLTATGVRGDAVALGEAVAIRSSWARSSSSCGSRGSPTRPRTRRACRRAYARWSGGDSDASATRVAPRSPSQRSSATASTRACSRTCSATRRRRIILPSPFATAF